MKESVISDATIRRLPIYLRLLDRKMHHGIERVSSQEIGDELGFKSSQVRKDLSHFGDFGKKGVGYDVQHLIYEIKKILNLDKEIAVCLVGFGKLGQAITNYNLHLQDNMEIKAIFDNNPKKVGNQIGQMTIQGISEMTNTVKEKNIKVGIIAVPHEYAQMVAEKMTTSGIRAILNFAPTTLSLSEGVYVRDVDYIAELHSLAYFLD